MNRRRLIDRCSVIAASCVLAWAGRAAADSDEAWLARAPLPVEVKPLLVFVLDTSAAMAGSLEMPEPYDPLTDYAVPAGAAENCDPTRIYWRRGPGPAPDCRAMTGLAIAPEAAATGTHCAAARPALGQYGVFVAARAAQWRPAAGAGYWGALRADSTDAVECRGDRAVHGSAAGAWYAAHGPQGPWSRDPADEIDWNAPPLADPYIFYTGNFLNYLAAAPRVAETTSAQQVAAGLTATIAATDELDIALVRLSDREPDAQGGFVALAPTAADVAAPRLRAMLDGWSASGAAPLAETLIETTAWLAGDAVLYGNDARADRTARDPADPGRYRSPFTLACRPVMIALLTAALPSQDDDARLAAQTLPGFSELTGGCGENCLSALTLWFARTDLRADLSGRQFAPVGWITPAAPPVLVTAALEAGGGKAESAQDPLAFVNVVARSLQHDAAVAAGPQLSSAGLLRSDHSAHAAAVVYGLSAPQARQRWLGNLLRYGLRAPVNPLDPPLVASQDGEPALDEQNGLPRPDSSSAWSDGPDGDRLLAGGAAARLPAADQRRIYSDLGADPLTAASNRLAPGYPSVSAALLGLSAHDAGTAEQAIAWLLNQPLLGDPGLRAPSIAGDLSTGSRTVFLATHDGLLHAFDADTGIERWAFLPRPLLRRLPELMRNEETTARGHGLDGSLLLHRYDPNGDGRIDAAAGEHLWLVFGLGRGGGGYYALDVAAPDEPRLLWSLGAPVLEPDAQSSAEPVVARLSIAESGQDPGAWVVFLAGGYDSAYDFAAPVSRAAGASLTIVDAATGRRLWTAAGDAAREPELQLPEMTHSLASAPRVLDLDGDGHADRLYAVDIAGGLWRFDLHDGATPAELASARLLARLGGSGQRFQSSPDPAALQRPEGFELAISIGSGWLARPRDTRVTDRFYSIRDRDAAVLREADLHDATDGTAPMPVSAPGWFVRLEQHGAGEKVVGSSVTFDYRLHLTTYQPVSATGAASCGPPAAVRRLRTLDVRSGLPVPISNVPGDPAEQELPGTGLPAQLRFAFPAPWDRACADCPARPFGLAGSELFDAGFANDPVKTSWRKLPNEPDSR